MRRTGLLGGTFDPVHLGHLLAAECAREGAKLDEVWFVPTCDPPHKARPGASAEARVAMLEAAIAGCPAFRIEHVELEKKGTSYTIDTVTSLQRQHPDRHFLWIVGSDMAKDLPNWRNIEQLAEIISFIALERPDDPMGDAELPAFIRRKLHRASMPAIGISSTDIRRRVRERHSIRFLVPERVEAIMMEGGLYGSDSGLGQA